MLDNSILVFVSDNSGRSDDVRTPALIWSSLLTKSGYVSDAIVDVTDLLPTVLEAIDGTDSLADERDIYGTNRRSQWSALSNNDRPVRRELIYNPKKDTLMSFWYRSRRSKRAVLCLEAYQTIHSELNPRTAIAVYKKTLCVHHMIQLSDECHTVAITFVSAHHRPRATGEAHEQQVACLAVT
ncbi:unnamed protein product [Oppiella nova]|uniref:Uncharacterized protein n=1 Tax=Oppiella nova TaxID=334625 RepID=A0A7R9QU61_9ACAR|nr:unnamed protein product [Oppiella nova]CAG2174512.1 unnamed protein product [Oppiella nova]